MQKKKHLRPKIRPRPLHGVWCAGLPTNGTGPDRGFPAFSGCDASKSNTAGVAGGSTRCLGSLARTVAGTASRRDTAMAIFAFSTGELRGIGGRLRSGLATGIGYALSVNHYRRFPCRCPASASRSPRTHSPDQCGTGRAAGRVASARGGTTLCLRG